MTFTGNNQLKWRNPTERILRCNVVLNTGRLTEITNTRFIWLAFIWIKTIKWTDSFFVYSRRMMMMMMWFQRVTLQKQRDADKKINITANEQANELAENSIFYVWNGKILCTIATNQTNVKKKSYTRTHTSLQVISADSRVENDNYVVKMLCW